jgi:hypothetical protein
LRIIEPISLNSSIDLEPLGVENMFADKTVKQEQKLQKWHGGIVGPRDPFTMNELKEMSQIGPSLVKQIAHLVKDGSKSIQLGDGKATISSQVEDGKRLYHLRFPVTGSDHIKGHFNIKFDMDGYISSARKFSHDTRIKLSPKEIQLDEIIEVSVREALQLTKHMLGTFQKAKK